MTPTGMVSTRRQAARSQGGKKVSPAGSGVRVIQVMSMRLNEILLEGRGEDGGAADDDGFRGGGGFRGGEGGLNTGKPFDAGDRRRRGAAGDDEIAAGGEGFLLEFVEGFAAHDDGLAAGHALKMLEVGGNMPGEMAVLADEAGGSHGDDEGAEHGNLKSERGK